MRDISNACRAARIAPQDEDGLYIMPMNHEKGKRVLYVQSDREGRKLSAFRENGQIAFPRDCGRELVEGARTCQYGYRCKSGVGNGEIAGLENPEKRRKDHRHGDVPPWRPDISFRDKMGLSSPFSGSTRAGLPEKAASEGAACFPGRHNIGRVQKEGLAGETAPTFPGSGTASRKSGI